MLGTGRLVSQDEVNAIDIGTPLSQFLRPLLRHAYDLNEVPPALVDEVKAIEADAKALTERVRAFIATYNADQPGGEAPAPEPEPS